ncbi:MAG: hypothetical protein JWM47_3821 [Acidimicrobiales bacterium]|nr:hypothetical protein [Acidimicrobiales bacterium]
MTIGSIPFGSVPLTVILALIGGVAIVATAERPHQQESPSVGQSAPLSRINWAVFAGSMVGTVASTKFDSVPLTMAVIALGIMAIVVTMEHPDKNRGL